MFDKLDDVVQRFESITHQLQNPDVAGDQNKFRKLMVERAELEKVVNAYQEYKELRDNLTNNKELIEGESDEDLRQLIKEDIQSIESQLPQIEQDLKLLLLPKDPNDDRDVILEVRAGAGGDEASLFAQELFEAYSHFASAKGWKVEVLSISNGNVGGYKEVVAQITGEKVYSMLKYESGVHRVQRVPKTETQGRVHTSTITVAVVPEADAVDVEINMNDVRIDTMRASGAGGQHVNRTESAVRLTHHPTGIVVYCQEGKSQHANRDKAFKVLFSRVKALEEEKALKEASETRLAQIGTGDRSERIRTYNFPQSRVTDHRIGLTLHSIHEIMKGDVDQLAGPLIAHYQAEALKAQESGH